jgi:hypothetical protein
MDLRNQQLSMAFLGQIIYAVDLVELLRTQTIDEVFAVNYVLNPQFQLTEEEEGITPGLVLQLQPHLDREKLLRLYVIGPSDFLPPLFDASK